MEGMDEDSKEHSKLQEMLPTITGVHRQMRLNWQLHVWP
jgi:hypothetical protein